MAAVASFRFQAGEAAFLFSFLSYLLPGRGSSFLCRAFAFRLNRCLRRGGRKRTASEARSLALCALRVVVCRLALGHIGRPSGLVEAAQESVSVSKKELVELCV